MNFRALAISLCNLSCIILHIFSFVNPFLKVKLSIYLFSFVFHEKKQDFIAFLHRKKVLSGIFFRRVPFPHSLFAFICSKKTYISPRPLSIALLTVSIAAASSSPSQISVISVPDLMPAAITFHTLFAMILFSPHSMITSHLNFIAVWDKTPAGLK